jgi:hypothetical protein
MSKRRKQEAVQADAGLEQAKKSSPLFRKLLMSQQGGQGHDHGSSLREDHYKGHHIVIETTYEVTVDGKKFTAPLDVSNAGTVQYHGIPNIGFASAIDLMKCIIDQFPEDFSGNGGKGKPPQGDHHGHDHAAATNRKRAKRR